MYQPQIKPLNGFYIHSKIENHKSVKDSLLEKISNSDAGRVYYENTDVNIYRCDWDKRLDENREWLQFISKDLKKTLTDCFIAAGYNDAFLLEAWFQQYDKNSQHGWHIHGHNFTGVYYVDLPQDKYKTEYLNPLNNKEIKFFDVKEGDLILFPSHLVHRAPILKDDFVKTIISFNIDVGYPEEK